MSPKPSPQHDPEEAQVKLEIALNAISKRCVEDEGTSTCRQLKTISSALKNGDKLVASRLSRSATACTNDSYRVYLQDQPDVAIFCKVCSPYANYDPNRSPLDLERIDNEFQALHRVAEIFGKNAPVAKPLFCIDAGTEDIKMKILVCEFLSGYETWDHQFAKGKVDQKVIRKAAEVIALLNASDGDPHFNDSVRSSHHGVLTLVGGMIESLACSTGEGDKAVLYFRELGVERCRSIISTMQEHYLCREVFLHNEYNLLNMLVVGKSQEDASMPDLFICDMEQSLFGPVGKDAGTWIAYPLVYAFLHAAAGHKDEAFHILDCCDQFFDSYAKAAVEVCGKDQEFLNKHFRSSLGWIAGFNTIVVYCTGVMESLAMEGFPDEARTKAKASAGYNGFRFAEIGFLDENPDLTLEELRALFTKIVSDEINELLSQASSEAPVS